VVEGFPSLIQPLEPEFPLNNICVGNTIAEERERDASNTVQKRCYPQVVQISGAAYFYTRDHLGSIRELVDGSGTIQARYDYDPYGRVTLIQGTNLADFQFAGYYEHQTSGLNLTEYRAYDPNTGNGLIETRSLNAVG
jgi:uncharacterized protein RhaS with RHS repeats